MDGPLGVRDLAEPILSPPEEEDPLLREQRGDLLSDAPFLDRVQRPEVGEEEGKVEQVQFVDRGGPVDRGGEGEVGDPLLEDEELVGLLPRHQGGGGVHLDVDPPLRPFPHEIRELRRPFAPRELGADHDAQLVFALVGRPRRGRQERRQGKRHRQCKQQAWKAAFHDHSPVIWICDELVLRGGRRKVKRGRARITESGYRMRFFFRETHCMVICRPDGARTVGMAMRIEGRNDANI